jgi:mannose-1-phosphate guanylyltransferase/mannose-6-phosphate isomerase
VLRFLDSPIAESISISTNALYEGLVRQQLAKIDPLGKTNVIVEPLRRNTAPAIAYGVRWLQEALGVGDDASVLVLPSDHLIEPESVFLHHLELMEPITQSDWFVIFGIHPTRPETGFGYIQIGEKFDPVTYRVKKFVEKPTLSVAEGYLASGDFYWNAGMIAFSARHFWEKMAELAPDIYAIAAGSIEEAHSRFAEMPDISFDYAMLEQNRKILVCPLPVSWSDVGSWDNVYEILKKDQNGNVMVGNVIGIETEDSLIIGGKRLISTIGLKEMLIVETDDAIFIAKKGHSQRVKELIAKMKAQKISSDPPGKEETR